MFTASLTLQVTLATLMAIFLGTALPTRNPVVHSSSNIVQVCERPSHRHNPQQKLINRGQ